MIGNLINIGKSSGISWKPLNLVATVISDTRIYLTWEGVDVGIIQSSTDGVTFTDIGLRANDFTAINLTPNTKYYFRIKGGRYSDIVDATTLTYLIAGYKFDVDASDYSANALNGAVTTATIDNNGKYGKCYNFPGSEGQKIEVADDAKLSFPDVATDVFPFIQAAGNPTFPIGAESEVIMDEDGVTCHRWYRRIVEPAEIYYQYANNALLDNWSVPVLCDVVGLFPTVFKIGTTYYMFVSQPWSNALAAQIYLYQSTNKINWTIMNGGNPAVIHTSPWCVAVFNVGAVAIGNTVHVLVDGSAAGYENYRVGYAVADISNPIFTLQNDYTFIGSNVSIQHIPKSNSLIVWSSEKNYLTNGGNNYVVRVIEASLNDDLTLRDSWKLLPCRFPTLDGTAASPSTAYPADFSCVFTPGKTHGMLMSYNWNQITGNQAYADFSIDTIMDALHSYSIAGFSISFWINPAIIGTNYVIAKGAANQREYEIFLYNNTIQFYALNLAASKYLSASCSFNTVGSWSFITCVYDGRLNRNSLQIFKNGELQVLTSANIGPFLGMANGTSPLYMGSYGGSFPYNGLLDEVKIFKKILSLNEQNAIMNNTKDY